MKSYTAMAGRYLKQQRKRSILTIVGIILSVSLISALGTMGQAIKDNMVLNTKYEEGSFHFGYASPTPELYEILKNNVMVDQFGYYHYGVTTELQDTYTVQINTGDKEAFQLIPAHLLEGHLPESDAELIVEQWLLERLPGKPKLNDSTQLNGPDGKPRTYQIVGILKNKRGTQVTGTSEAYTLVNPGSMIVDEKSMLFLTLKPGIDISDQIENFRALGQKDIFLTNHKLLALMGETSDNGLNSALFIIFGTLVGLVVLSTAAVIYNAFHIAVLERIRQFGLLRTLGATPRQIRNLVFREATVLAAIGVPLGLLVGWFGLWFALWLMMQNGISILQMEDFQLTFHWWIMGGSLLIGFLAIYLAAWLPARKASSVSPVEAVRGAGSIVRESIRRARIPSLLHLIGIEGQMASKNIRRNKSKFRITTFSIVISITLFIVFHYFTQQSLHITTTSNGNDRTAFELYQTVYPNKDGQFKQIDDIISDEELKEISDLPGVYGAYGTYQNLDAQVFVPDSMLNSRFPEITQQQLDQTEWRGTPNYIVYSSVILYDEARFKETAKYLKAGATDFNKLDAENGVLLIQTVKPKNKITGNKEIMDITQYEVGDTLTLRMGYSDSPTEEMVRNVTISGILTQSPFNASYLQNGLMVITTKATYAKLLAAIPATVADDQMKYHYGTARYGLEVALEDGADPAPIKVKLEELIRTHPGTRLVDIADQQREERQFNLQMQIFVYSFLVIIGVIGSLNIINTVQTNLLLRRKEIGLLQAVGMTMGQIRKMASTEGLWFGVIGSFWGILLGVGFSYFLHIQLNNVQGMPFSFPWGASLIAGGFALLVGLISVQGPLRKMEKANLLEQLREEA